MEQYSIPVLPNQQQQQQPFPSIVQRSYPPTHRLSVGGPPFTNVFGEQINIEKLPRQKNETKKKINFLPPFLSLILGSTYFLVALCIILIIPILQLAIGIAYIKQCPINLYIPIYLIVTGACGFAGVGLTIVIVR